MCASCVNYRHTTDALFLGVMGPHVLGVMGPQVLGVGDGVAPAAAADQDYDGDQFAGWLDEGLPAAYVHDDAG